MILVISVIAKKQEVQQPFQVAAVPIKWPLVETAATWKGCCTLPLRQADLF